MHLIGIYLPGLYNFLDLGYHQCRGRCSSVIKIVFRHAVLQIAGAISTPGSNQCNVTGQRFDKDHLGTIDDSGFTPFCQHGACTRWCKKTANACTRRPDRLAQCALRQQLALDLTFQVCVDNFAI